MMKSLRNSVQLIGRLGKDPEVKSFSNSKKASFSIATTDTYKNQKGEKIEDTQWHNIVIWGKLAGVAEKYL
ncbi:MAG TPA: single-stranded DNA-binding protein, partial [Chryseosolibacter sp.]|nr:single-stranded DNA-binding protein [Chryseosolibacter sp.]